MTAGARDIVAVMRFLRDDARCQFWNFIDVTAIDWPGRERRFDVVYHLLSPKQNMRIRVKAETGRGRAGTLDHRGLSRRRLVRARDL